MLCVVYHDGFYSNEIGLRVYHGVTFSLLAKKQNIPKVRLVNFVKRLHIKASCYCQ